MLKGNLILLSKYRWNIEKWIFGKLMSLIFLNEEVEKFTSRWSQNLFNVRSPSYVKQNAFGYRL